MIDQPASSRLRLQFAWGGGPSYSTQTPTAMQIFGMQKCNLAAVDSGPFQEKEIASEAS